MIFTVLYKNVFIQADEKYKGESVTVQIKGKLLTNSKYFSLYVVNKKPCILIRQTNELMEQSLLPNKIGIYIQELSEFIKESRDGHC